MKKFAALMIVLSACLFTATGCGGDDEAAEGENAPAEGSGTE